MQNNSTPQNPQQEIHCEFPKNLIGEMWDANVTFETIMHIPTLLATNSHRVSDQFQDFLSAAYEPYTSAQLLKQCPELESTLQEIRENEQIEEYAGEVAQDIYNNCGQFEFLILISIRIPYNFSFDENGKYRSNSLGGAFQQQWILSKKMIDAAQTAIAMAEELHSEEEQKARKEQGLEG